MTHDDEGCSLSVNSMLWTSYAFGVDPEWQEDLAEAIESVQAGDGAVLLARQGDQLMPVGLRVGERTVVDADAGGRHLKLRFRPWGRRTPAAAAP
ncbi:hypothetical protein ACGFRB_00945 [Streptomyces sp. NPDC048718]|uniref:hypothetical protein n=1 Tax=Streptomyces sp. NPDC048718 TaxID=3365587 RepID=UPI0037197FC7